MIYHQSSLWTKKGKLLYETFYSRHEVLVLLSFCCITWSSVCNATYWKRINALQFFVRHTEVQAYFFSKCMVWASAMGMWCSNLHNLGLNGNLGYIGLEQLFELFGLVSSSCQTVLSVNLSIVRCSISWGLILHFVLQFCSLCEES